MMTTGVLYPIDGFESNREDVLKAMEEFTGLLTEYFGGSSNSFNVTSGIVDKDAPRFEF